MGKARVCAVYGCTPAKTSDLKYYKFPSNKDRAKQWVHKTGRADGINLKRAVICSIHFSKAQIIKNLQSELMDIPVPPNFRNLREDAIPDQNLPARQDVAHM